MLQNSLIRALIIDDELSAIETLRGMLGQFCPEVTIVAEATNIRIACEKAEQHKPNLVFLDIEMPPFSKGFDFLKKTQDLSYGVIFATAYPQYAVQAINEIQPWGYLIKPYRVADLVKAVKKAQEKINSEARQKIVSLPEYQRLIIPDHRLGKLVLNPMDILYCASDLGTSDIYFLKNGTVEKCTASKTLKELASALPAELFCRTHHKYLVNMSHILRYKRTGRNGIIVLSNDHIIAISVMKMDDFEKTFQRFLQPPTPTDAPT
ncbi:MAG TPA: response regulator transcription factor [Saprospiraceae bacterium]|nr:response regulator transcription factor [Saprospiraceae bacterium]